MSSTDKIKKIKKPDLEIYPSFNYKKVYNKAGNNVTDLIKNGNYSFLNIIQDVTGNYSSFLFSNHEIINN